MNVIFDQLDMHKTQQNWPKDTPFQPALVKNRKGTTPSKWLVLSSPFSPGSAPTWSSSERDEFIRIPLFPYLVQSPEADRALAFAFQLGLACAGYLPGKVSALHVVTGVPVQLLYDAATEENTGLRFWFGFAVVLEKS